MKCNDDTPPTIHRGSPWLPWCIALAVCGVTCLATLGVLHNWHLRERDVLEGQANAMVHALGSALRAMSARVQRSDGTLDGILAEVVDSGAVGGVALIDENGHCVAGAGLSKEWLAAGGAEPKGAVYYENDILVWDTVNAGQCRGWGRGFHGGRQAVMAEQPPPTSPVKLFASMPLTTLRSRWQHDSVLASVVCIVAFAAAIAAAATWSLARRSAAYSAQLRVADEERRTLAEVNVVAAGLAHEIKNPLGVIRGTAQHLAAQPSASEELAEPLEIIIQEIDQVTSRVNELLAFANPREPVLQPVRLRQELGSLERLMAAELADAGLSLDLDGVSAEVVLHADLDQIRRLLFNLMHNAIRFASSTGAVVVGLAQATDGSWTLAFRDHGPGVPPELRQRIFSAYFTTSPAGTGLGLATAKRVARAHGWAISCGEAVGGGALFAISGIAPSPAGAACGFHTTTPAE